jgi:ABC-2 type transport system ATP-binding protein
VKALSVRNVSHRFGARAALADVSFDIAPGEFAVLLGRNGAGKTTLMSLITRLYFPRTGEIEVFGRAIRSSPREALVSLGVVFQSLTLDLDLSVRENLRYHAGLHGLSRCEADGRGADVLARFELSDRLRAPARTLSGGLRRRLEIARALLHQPRLLLLDEPTVGLDLPSRRSLLSHVRALCREKGIAALWATHLIDEVEEQDTVILLHEGRVLRTGRAQDIRRESGALSLGEGFISLTEAVS